MTQHDDNLAADRIEARFNELAELLRGQFVAINEQLDRIDSHLDRVEAHLGWHRAEPQ